MDVGKESSYGSKCRETGSTTAIKPEASIRQKRITIEKTKEADISSFEGDMKVSGDSIYYVDGTSLFKMKTDGTEVMKLSENVVIYAVEGDWIYYGEKNEKGNLRM